MKIVTDSHGIKYKCLDNGTCYHADTNEKVVKILENAREKHNRIRVFYGDVKPGKSWNDEYNTIGYIGRSSGSIKIPLMIYSERSYGGPGLLENRIVRITKDKYVLYTHPKFNIGKVSISKGMVYIDGKEHAKFINNRIAYQYVLFLRGERDTVPSNKIRIGLRLK